MAPGEIIILTICLVLAVAGVCGYTWHQLSGKGKCCGCRGCSGEEGRGGSSLSGCDVIVGIGDSRRR